MSTSSTTLVRESPWVREYSVDGERILDSKYRTYDCEATATELISAFRAASSDVERDDLEAAAEFFPSEAGLREIVEAVGKFDPLRAGNIDRNWFHRTGEWRPATRRLVQLLCADLYAGRPIRRLVLDAPSVRAYFDGQSFSFDRQQRTLTPDELAEARNQARSRVARDALQLFQGEPPDTS